MPQVSIAGIELTGLKITEKPKYVVFNGGDRNKPVDLSYSGENFTVPKANEVVEDKGNGRFCSAKDSEGNYIPGTLVIHDIDTPRVWYDRQGNDVGAQRAEMMKLATQWSAVGCLKHCLGLDPVNGTANSLLTARGVTILPYNPDPEFVKMVREGCEKLYRDWGYNQDLVTVEFFDRDNARRLAQGGASLLPTVGYQEAVARINMRRKEGFLAPETALPEQFPGVTVAPMEKVEPIEDKIAKAVAEALEKAGVRAATTPQAVPQTIQTTPSKETPQEQLERLLSDPKLKKELKVQGLKISKAPGRKSPKPAQVGG